MSVKERNLSSSGRQNIPTRIHSESVYSHIYTIHEQHIKKWTSRLTTYSILYYTRSVLRQCVTANKRAAAIGGANATFKTQTDCHLSSLSRSLMTSTAFRSSSFSSLSPYIQHPGTWHTDWLYYSHFSIHCSAVAWCYSVKLEQAQSDG